MDFTPVHNGNRVLYDPVLMMDYVVVPRSTGS